MTYAELFAGVSGMGMGFDRAGFNCLWRVEFDRAAAGVIAHHAPETPLYRDVIAFAAWLRRKRLTLSKSDYDQFIINLRPVVLAGGSPCQDLSMAGGRAGLDGGRSGLFHVMVRICRLLQPRFVVWENVVGALSSNEGRDFARVIGAFTGCVPEVPDNGCATAGFARAAEPGRWNVAWRVLDSQYFGVPQRRRRVFLIGSLGDGSCAEILFEPESVRGDYPPRRKSREGVAGTLNARTKGGGGLGTDLELDGGLVAREGVSDIACHQAKGGDPTTDNYVAHTLRAEGFDASEDGTGRGTPLVAGTLCSSGKAAGSATQQDVESGLLVPSPIAFSCKDHGNDAGDIAPTLRAMGHTGSHANSGGQVAIAFRTSPNCGAWSTGDRTDSLTTQTDRSATVVSISGRARGDDGRGYSRPEQTNEEIVGALDTVKPDRVAQPGMGVRRLTPKECERLQSWPDDHTKFRRKLRASGNTWVSGDPVVEQSDGPRYKQAGNGVTSNVVEWFAKRMAKEVHR